MWREAGEVLNGALGWEEGTWPLLFFKDYSYLNWSFTTMSLLQPFLLL